MTRGIEADMVGKDHYVDIESFGPLEKVDCALCESNEFSVVTRQKWFGEDFSIVRCNNCHLIYTNPRPTHQWRERFYDPKYNPAMHDADRDFLYLPQQTRLPAYRRLIDFIKDDLGVAGKVLDGGCAAGQFVKMLSDAGFDASGFERSPEAIAYGEERFGLKLILAEVDSIPVPDNTYDVVTLLHVFEHFREPVQALKEVRRVLKPGGLIFIETVNYLKFYLFEKYFNFLKTLYLKMKSSDAPVWREALPWFPFDHYYHWTAKTLNMTLEKAGFNECRSHIINNYNSEMLPDGNISKAQEYHLGAIKVLFDMSGERLNLWGVLLASAVKK